MVAAAVRTVFAQPQPDMVRGQLGVIAGMRGHATDLLRRLLGALLRTLNGRPNRILRVTLPTSRSATERSPAGRW